MSEQTLKEKVKAANKALYDHVGDRYEQIDGRRSNELFQWVRGRLKTIAEKLHGETVFLDVGCGTGFLLKAAEGLFTKRYGIDISHKVLREAAKYCEGVICCDSDDLPLKPNSVDAVVLFATVHHFYDWESVIDELARVLKPNGILYMDHDINKDFVDRFKMPLNLYRNLFQKKKKYTQSGVGSEIYDLSEFHANGVDVKGVLNTLAEKGFEILIEHHHWYGLHNWINHVFQYKRFPRGYAPVTSIMAQKKYKY